MRKLFLTFIAMSILCASCTKEPELTDQHENVHPKLLKSLSAEKKMGHLMVKFSEDAVARIEKGEDVLDVENIDDICPMFLNPKNVNTAKKYGLHQWYDIYFDSEIPVEDIIQAIEADEDILLIEHNSLISHSHNMSGAEFVPVPTTKSAADINTSVLPFDDPELSKQWHLINSGDQEVVPHSVAGADIAVKDAWRLSTGDTRVIVAVFDIGVMTFHPDLKNVLWVNDAENNGTLGTDDDGNGYRDDINGYNFYSDKGTLEATGNSSTVSHGTHVAGSIAAQNGNGKGVSSIAGGSGSEIYDGVRIMSCQIFKAGNSNVGNMASASQIAKAFIYAADNGACIAQCSFGSDEAYNSESAEYKALQYFTDPQNANCEAVDRNIAVFSAGNYNANRSLYPAAFPFCISVTAIGPDFLPAGYSNYGQGCDIAAPGGDPCLAEMNEIGKDMRTCILSTGVTGTGGTYMQAGYVYNFGTSMACPQVSGVVALGMSYALKLGKTFSYEDFVSRLYTSATDINPFIQEGQTRLYWNGKEYISVDLTAKKGKMGSGTVDTWKFLMALEGTPTVMTKPGKETIIDVAEYIGSSVSNLDYDILIEDSDMTSLGIDSEPAVNNGFITLTCNKIGSGKIQIIGNGLHREISLISRSSVTNNGGWL